MTASPRVRQISIGPIAGQTSPQRSPSQSGAGRGKGSDLCLDAGLSPFVVKRRFRRRGFASRSSLPKPAVTRAIQRTTLSGASVPGSTHRSTAGPWFRDLARRRDRRRDVYSRARSPARAVAHGKTLDGNRLKDRLHPSLQRGGWHANRALTVVDRHGASYRLCAARQSGRSRIPTTERRRRRRIRFRDPSPAARRSGNPRPRAPR